MMVFLNGSTTPYRPQPVGSPNFVFSVYYYFYLEIDGSRVQIDDCISVGVGVGVGVSVAMMQYKILKGLGSI